MQEGRQYSVQWDWDWDPDRSHTWLFRWRRRWPPCAATTIKSQEDLTWPTEQHPWLLSKHWEAHESLSGFLAGTALGHRSLIVSSCWVLYLISACSLFHVSSAPWLEASRLWDLWDIEETVSKVMWMDHNIGCHWCKLAWWLANWPHWGRMAWIHCHSEEEIYLRSNICCFRRHGALGSSPSNSRYLPGEVPLHHPYGHKNPTGGWYQ